MKTNLDLFRAICVKDVNRLRVSAHVAIVGNFLWSSDLWVGDKRDHCKLCIDLISKNLCLHDVVCLVFSLVKVWPNWSKE